MSQPFLWSRARKRCPEPIFSLHLFILRPTLWSMFYAFLGGVEMDGSSIFNQMFSSGKEIERIPRESVLTKFLSFTTTEITKIVPNEDRPFSERLRKHFQWNLKHFKRNLSILKEIESIKGIWSITTLRSLQSVLVKFLSLNTAEIIKIVLNEDRPFSERLCLIPFLSLRILKECDGILKIFQAFGH